MLTVLERFQRVVAGKKRPVRFGGGLVARLLEKAGAAIKR
jgi:hypothetical protein